jgi:arylsulfatase/uncharacterized sulfatase
MKRSCVPLLTFLGLAAAAFQSSAAEDRPNILVILADDLGYTDIAPYGSEINTPSLSALANEGIRFSNYHTAASCAPTRGMLLTGVDSHRNGVPNIPEALPPAQRAQPHYRGVLASNVVTIATLLESAGYHTYLSGKWHLGMADGQLPSQRGFERTVALMDTGADNWEQKPYLPIYEKANWYENGRELTLPEDFYSSRYLVDRMIGFIDEQLDDAPFFGYLSFQAVHIPVQAPREYTERYLGVYDDGWTALRESRRAKAVELGLIPEDASMVTMSTTYSWEALSEEQRRYESKRMAVYAGMVEAMDFQIGRLIAYLRAEELYDNTIIIFTSDNGTEATVSYDVRILLNRLALDLQGYQIDYETLGEKGSFNTISASFASAAAAPLAYYKFYSGEGGMRVPLLISGKPLSLDPAMETSFTYVTDLPATVLDMAGVDRPQGRFGGRPVEVMTGRSLLPLLSGETDRLYGPEESIGYELAGNSALFMGDYKIVLNRGPVGDGKWHLYNIVTDPGEARDLAGEQPELLEKMLAEYQRYVEENNVLPVPEGYSQLLQVTLNGIRERAGKQILLLVMTLAIGFLFYWIYRRRQHN